MPNVPFFIVTVDHVPDYLREFKIIEMKADWSGASKPGEALSKFKEYAMKNGYHGIVGLRYSNYERVGGGMAGIGSVTSFFVYGTVVKFE
jgi:uncharacterized protein YbjQ (UPF0145 family)